MKINKQTISNAGFVVCDEVTGQWFGGRIDFGGGNADYEDFPDQIYFPNIGELEDTINLLTDMYERAMKARDEQE
jgi:hypothetical protein